MNAKSRPLDERYFEWLYNLVANSRERNPAKSHWLLFEILFTTPFQYFVPNDHNRAGDGIKLREEFFDKRVLREDPHWLGLECSMFEMLIGLARRLEYQSSMSMDVWFWRLLENLEIEKYHDERMNDGVADAIKRVCHTINSRTYDRNGRGGLFPLRRPSENQREVEIWYQMAAYLMEHEELLWS